MIQTSIALGNKRLLKLADLLFTVDAIHRKKREPTYKQTLYAHHKCGNNCDTPACAWGHYITIPSVSRRLKQSIKDYETISWYAAQNEFVMTFVECSEIFASWGCNYANTAKEAAKYIRQFVKARQAKIKALTTS